MPYAQIVGVPKADGSKITKVSQLNTPNDTITALLGSTDQTQAKTTFPKAKINALADQNSDFSLVATGRANAIVVEDYLLAQYNKANPGKLAQAKIKPLDVQYGSYGVQHGNTRADQVPEQVPLHRGQERHAGDALREGLRREVLPGSARLQVMTLPRSTTDVLVVGGGPAGMAAAAQAAAAGLSVTLVDERVTLGGQIYKRMGPGFEVDEPARDRPRLRRRRGS